MKTTITIEIDIPAGYEVDESLAHKMLREKRPADWDSWVSEQLWLRPKPLLVPASTYRELPYHLEVVDPRFRDDLSRPVVMKGCRIARIARHTRSAIHCPNGYCEELFDRYLRRIEYTEIDPDKIIDFASKVKR